MPQPVEYQSAQVDGRNRQMRNNVAHFIDYAFESRLCVVVSAEFQSFAALARSASPLVKSGKGKDSAFHATEISDCMQFEVHGKRIRRKGLATGVLMLQRTQYDVNLVRAHSAPLVVGDARLTKGPGADHAAAS